MNIGLQDTGTQGQLGDRSILGVNTMKVENCDLVLIDDSSVSPVGLGLVIVQDGQSLVCHVATEC